MRWTVDEEEDFLFITKIYENLYYKNHQFTMQDILNLLEKKPGLQNINRKYMRNEGFAKSLIADQAFLRKEGNKYGGDIK